jgi:hypothetical protein
VYGDSRKEDGGVLPVAALLLGAMSDCGVSHMLCQYIAHALRIGIDIVSTYSYNELVQIDET